MRKLTQYWVLASLLWLCSAFAQAEQEELAADLNETVIQIPGIERGQSALVGTSYRPSGAGPFPLVILSHGNPLGDAERQQMGRFRKIPQIRAFVQRGYAVVVPMRRGFGDTGGRFVEGYARCTSDEFARAGLAAATDVLATLEFAKTLDWVDPHRIILAGQSGGGFASLAAASKAPAGVIAVINFSGGRGGDPIKHPGVPCGSDQMAKTLAQFARTTLVPSLWLYSQNDQYFGPAYVKNWHATYASAGANATLKMLPAMGDNGHNFFHNDQLLSVWAPVVEQFLRTL